MRRVHAPTWQRPAERASNTAAQRITVVADNVMAATAARVPDLPRDLLRAIWQRAWHNAAAGSLQRAWRSSRMRRAWAQWSWRHYLIKYMRKPSLEEQSLYPEALLLSPADLDAMYTFEPRLVGHVVNFPATITSNIATSRGLVNGCRARMDSLTRP